MTKIALLATLISACGEKEERRPGRILRSNPGNGSIGVALDTGIEVELSDPVDLPAQYHLVTTSEACNDPFELSADNFATCLPTTICLIDANKVGISPAENFQKNTKYYLKMRGLRFIGANPAEETIITFSTSPRIPTQDKSAKEKICEKN
jgi:hypothetical protein